MRREDYIEKLEALRRKRRGPLPVLDKLTVNQLMGMIKKEKQRWVCAVCGGELTAIPWNEQVDVLICKNVVCPHFHTPAGHIPAATEKELVPVGVKHLKGKKQRSR